ncbi:MAG TPA: lanthionine synthetase LanC family protein [Longimicrobium sp.]|nr:lanthionine synthetase LanC family protein [Longimicrobium sp.]
MSTDQNQIPPHVPQAQPGTDAFFLEAARRIGERVAAAAEWTSDTAATWTVMSPDRDNPALRVAKPATASGTFYEGTSGIALFLAHLWDVTGRSDDALLKAALGGIQYALDETGELPAASFGFHGGRVGIAYAAAVIGRLAGRPELVRAAQTVLEGAAGHEEEDRGLDVIGGGGGAIQALVAMAPWLDDPQVALGMARRLGDHLIGAADHEPEGWCWGTMRGSAVRHLCGYAHGSAGVGHALLELYLATGDSRYRYAMEQAFLYESCFFDPESSNWPDLRHGELGEYLYAGRTEELKQRLLAGDDLPPQPARYMSAWCHGAPGIGLSRLRAWQTLGEAAYLDDARAALRATLASLEDPRMNYSLCHGRGGNAETLMVAAEVLGERELLERPRQVAVEGWETYEAKGQRWACGTMQGAPDPGLLLGESGIAYFLLRLARPGVPSVLVVTPGDGARAPDDGGAGHAALQRQTVEEYFGRSLELLRALGAPARIPVRAPGVPTRSDVTAAEEALAASVAAEADPARREVLEDAVRLDRERYELSRSVDDFTQDFLSSLLRMPDDEVRWPEARIGLSPRARVVHGAYDWDEWVADEDRGATPEPADTFHLLQATGRRVAVRRLSPFAALVLQAVENPAGVDDVVDRVQEAVSTDGGGPSREWLEDRVTEQLRQAYRAGFITVTHGVPAGAA